MMRL